MLTINVNDRQIEAQTEEAILWFIKKFGLGRFRSLEIEISFTKGLKKNTNGYGFTTWVDGHANPRDFEIEIDLDHAKSDRFEFVGTILHEMVHVKQFLTRDLRDTPFKDRVLWKGALMNTAEIDYVDHPWEIEAYALESVLLDEFIEQTDIYV